MVADSANDGGDKIMVAAVCVLGFRERIKFETSDIEHDKLHDTKVIAKHIALHSALSQLASEFDGGEYDVLAETFIVDRMLVYVFIADELLRQTQGALSFTLQFKLIQEKTNADHIRMIFNVFGIVYTKCLSDSSKADLIAPKSERLLKSVVRVHWQEDADLFYVPFFTSISYFLLEKQQCKTLYKVRIHLASAADGLLLLFRSLMVQFSYQPYMHVNACS
ncbi:probable arabinosyltransferase ARAD1 [Tanacetum coccineum]|uniref:Probable arabinosyltransferase ARAD1 n=1 Tax=Tanacetum coccineum TaxID=301880 RepID=A0ABQ5FKN0_9ASTR